MRLCPKCKAAVNDWAKQCPKCGAKLHCAVLTWSGFEVRPKKEGHLWLIVLTDEQGNQHSWAPRWDDLFSALIGASVIETKDARSTEWVDELADTATVVLETCAERLVPLLGSVEGARHLLQECQQRFSKVLSQALEQAEDRA